MDSRLLLPATPELLDGWCGPVVSHFKTADAVEGEWLLLRQRSVMGDVARWHLDLARAECRDRVARVVWARLTNTPTWTTAPDIVDEDALIRIGLDPADGSRLPDGSRLVDALALAAVAREVLR